MIRKILPADDPILREKSKKIKKFDKKIAKLAKDLKDTLLAQDDPEGVGLAAPQIGKKIQIFVMRYEDKVKTIANPEIISISPLKKAKKKKDDNVTKKKILEGCLSVPHHYGPLKRPQKLTLKYKTVSGKEKVETFTGFPAQIVQHEVDHLYGVLFIDKLLQQKKPLYEIIDDEWHEVELIF
jgi:peptide deformylase